MVSSKGKQAHDYALIAMCYHEASHSICALLNYINVESIYVMSEKNDHGKTSYEAYDPAKIESKYLAKILIMNEVQTIYAGTIGERIYYKEICGSDNFPMHLREGSSEDVSDAAALIHKNNLAEPGKLRFLFKKQLQLSAQNLLLQYWSDVRLLSHALYRHIELNGQELRQLLSRKSENKDFWRTRFKELKTIYAESKEIDERELKDILLHNKIVIM